MHSLHDGRKLALDTTNMLLRGCVLRNTKRAVGMVGCSGAIPDQSAPCSSAFVLTLCLCSALDPACLLACWLGCLLGMMAFGCAGGVCRPRHQVHAEQHGATVQALQARARHELPGTTAVPNLITAVANTHLRPLPCRSCTAASSSWSCVLAAASALPSGRANVTGGYEHDTC